ncbi:CDP-glycerol glycerophosphotransferase family protein [Lacisediminihabitans changchengi]|uniref:CDP-glycerol glycerophosphotransferase family protein n=1 Tax=Lacisediminihabitans changchengi TaxID=2787634 RepID=A0A934SLX7_9MICO|nr:CDP-glycerol glycerophosphotransferase family protein [Lacisediminihabitans changchengi]MBK4347382.1 CDP-glycerol glycerophosphotransferase family protein [Lacisediminihabitans changchengi]
MPLLNDARTAIKLARNLYTSRQNRKRVAVRVDEQPPLPAKSVKIAVYFADTKVNLYQIRQWYEPLAELAKTHSVAIIARSPGTALALMDESPVPVVYLRKIVELEDFVAAQDIRIVFYVNQNAKNFQMFRYGRMWHVFINHGESDKMYMTTNQFKAYDFSLIAGEAARDRLRRKLWDFDLDRRTIMIGRPQTDHLAGALPWTPDERMVVLYSPTWEGDRGAAAYGSVPTHGEALVGSLLSTGRHRVIYRPHPRTGVIDPATRTANRNIIASIAAANAADPQARHLYDDGGQLGWQVAAADVAITDVSAMVYDRLATGKPLIVTRPVSPDADIDEDGYLGQADWLYADTAGDIVTLADRVLVDEEAQSRLRYWVERHFGDTTPGASTRRFHAAVDQLLAEWDRNAELHANDVDEAEVDPFESDSDDDED